MLPLGACQLLLKAFTLQATETLAHIKIRDMQSQGIEAGGQIPPPPPESMPEAAATSVEALAQVRQHGRVGTLLSGPCMGYLCKLRLLTRLPPTRLPLC